MTSKHCPEGLQIAHAGRESSVRIAAGAGRAMPAQDQAAQAAEICVPHDPGRPALQCMRSEGPGSEGVQVCHTVIFLC